jgi:protein-S-isoprenylcysteine O-methyltransferase Ste14
MTAITAQYIILACWIIFLLYWLVSWWSIKPTQEKSWGIGRFRRVIIGLVIAFVLLNNFGTSIPFFTISLIPRSTPLSVAGVILVITGLGIAIVARRTLAGNWSNAVDVKVDHELITTGIYRYARHPIYTGVLLMGLGTALSKGTMGIFILFLALLGFFWFKAREEEKLLTKYFPKEYPAYKKRVKALIPYVF